MEFGREAVAEHLVKNNMPTSAKLKKAFKEFVDDDWIAKDLEKCHERIMELRDKTLLVEFARKICLLLAENGIKVVGNIVDDMSFDEENNIYSGKSELDIEHLDFSEHDNPFEDKIASLENQIAYMKEKNSFLRTRCMEDAVDAFDRGSYGALTIVGRRGALEAENKELKRRIAELESEKSEKPVAYVLAKEIDGQHYVTVEDFISVVNNLQ